MFCYHYCTVQQQSNGSLDYRDGIATLSYSAATAEGYEHLKRFIAKQEPATDPAGLVMLSLTPMTSDYYTLPVQSVTP